MIQVVKTQDTLMEGRDVTSWDKSPKLTTITLFYRAFNLQLTQAYSVMSYKYPR
jgi:hypothetical protein